MDYFSNWFGTHTKSLSTSVKKTVAKVEKFANKLETKVAHLATDLAYKLAKGGEAYKKFESATIESIKNDGWKVLCNSSQFADTNQNGYKTVVFVKDKYGAKEVLIAVAGTVSTDINDLKDDFYVATGSYPSKVVQIKAMLNHISELLGSGVSNYKFDVTGHSLGAVLTDMTAFEIMSRGFSLGTSITFDSPGSKNSINEAIKSGVFSNNTNVTIEDLAEHCVVYNSKHNIINYNPVINSPHITAPNLVLPVKKVATDVASYTTEPSGIIGYASYLVSKVSTHVVKTCSDYLGITRTLTELENLVGHPLKNFADLCEKPVITTECWKKEDGILVVKDFKGLKHVTSTGNDIITSRLDDDFVVITAYSFDDVQRTHDYNNNNVLLSGAEESDFVFIN